MILTDRVVSLDEIEALLPEWPFVKRVEAAKIIWMGGDCALVPYRPEVNGYLHIDIVPAAWPDGMGDPKGDSMLFGSWSMGYLGPFSYPRGLSRAQQQARLDPGAKELVPKHSSFVRLRLTYAFAASPTAKCLPQDYDPRPELAFLTELLRPLLRLPGALCYFNPNGEVLAGREVFERSLAHHRQHNLPSLDLWSNVRLYDVNPEWVLLDTVGLSQIDAPDLEAVLPKGRFPIDEVVGFLRNTTYYLWQNGQVIKHGDTLRGPGGLDWRAFHFEKPLTDPPRPTICFLPVGQSNVPKVVTDREPPKPPTPPSLEKKRWWQF